MLAFKRVVPQACTGVEKAVHVAANRQIENKRMRVLMETENISIFYLYFNVIIQVY